MPTQSEVRLGSALGRFGLPELSRASDPLVSAGYASIPVGSRGDLIQARLPGGALDRGGYVQVVNGGRWSNAVQVTHWEIPVRVERAITGGLLLLVEITLQLRADVRGYRLQPDGQRLNGAPMVPLSCSARSSARYQASGEISRTVLRETTTISWSGSGAIENPPGGQLNISAGGLLMWAARRFPVAVTALSPTGHDSRTVVTRSDPELGVVTVSDVTTQVGISIAVPGGIAGIGPELVFDANWVLQPGGFDLPETSVDLLGTRTLTTQLRWGNVAPSFPPNQAGVGGI